MVLMVVWGIFGRRAGAGRSLDHRHQPVALAQRPGELGGANERDGIQRKGNAVLRGAQAVVVDEHKGRACQVHKKARHGGFFWAPAQADGAPAAPFFIA